MLPIQVLLVTNVTTVITLVALMYSSNILQGYSHNNLIRAYMI